MQSGVGEQEVEECVALSLVSRNISFYPWACHVGNSILDGFTGYCRTSKQCNLDFCVWKSWNETTDVCLDTREPRFLVLSCCRRAPILSLRYHSVESLKPVKSENIS